MTPHLVWIRLPRRRGHAGLEQRGAAPRPRRRSGNRRPRGTAAAPGKCKGSMMSRPDTCDWADVQGLVRSGYKQLPHAAYVLFRIVDAGWARGFLASLLPDVTRGRDKPGERALNVALSCQGLRVLAGVDDPQMSSFPYPFSEGMAGTRHRSRVLGDIGDSDPDQWFWGGRHRPVHGLLVMYHREAHELATWVNQLRSAQTSGLKWMTEVTTSPYTGREAFGFRDGLSQPLIAGLTCGTRASRLPPPREAGRIPPWLRRQRRRGSPGACAGWRSGLRRQRHLPGRTANCAARRSILGLCRRSRQSRTA